MIQPNDNVWRLAVVLLLCLIWSLPALAVDSLDLMDDPAMSEADDFSFEDDIGFEAEFADEKAASTVSDPLYPVNRVIFSFNNVMYDWVLRPVAKGWGIVVPDVARTGLKNFFSNLGAPVRMINALLQRKTDRFENEFGRFMVNTIAGLGGFMDPARTHFGRLPQDEDLGQTLAVYGVGDGCYLVLPLLGPSTLRDAVGTVGEYFMNPVRYIVDDTGVTVTATGVDTINFLSFRYPDIDTVREAAIDPYAAFRDGYMQMRKTAIED